MPGLALWDAPDLREHGQRLRARNTPRRDRHGQAESGISRVAQPVGGTDAMIPTYETRWGEKEISGVLPAGKNSRSPAFWVNS